MGYYKGDFYRGDFYRGARGDPGIFSFLGGIGKGLLGLLPGGGTAIETIGAASRATGLIPRAGGAIAGAGRTALGTIMKHPVLTAAGAAGALGGAAFELGGLMAPAGGVMRGFHMSKPHRRYGVYPKPPHLVRNRRMRVTNPRALHRSLRRISGFARVARRVLHFTHPRAARGRPRFRFRRRSRAA